MQSSQTDRKFRSGKLQVPCSHSIISLCVRRSLHVHRRAPAPAMDATPRCGYRPPVPAASRAPMDPLLHPLVIVNPSAGRGRAARVRAAVESYWRQQGLFAYFLVAASPDEVRLRSSEAARAGYSCVIALGGDGTVHEVINGAAGTGTVVGVLPAGGGNDLVRALGLPL